MRDASLPPVPSVGVLPAGHPGRRAAIEASREALTEGGPIRRTRAKVDGPSEGALLP